MLDREKISIYTNFDKSVQAYRVVAHAQVYSTGFASKEEDLESMKLRMKEAVMRHIYGEMKQHVFMAFQRLIDSASSSEWQVPLHRVAQVRDQLMRDLAEGWKR